LRFAAKVVGRMAGDSPLHRGRECEDTSGGINVARVMHRLGGDCEPLYMAGGLLGGTLSAMIGAEGVPATSC
jgi:fructose-1-phosphate kinase PfkB-like protein